MRHALRRARAHGQYGSTGPAPREVPRVVPPPTLAPIHCDPAELRRIARRNQRGNRGQTPSVPWR